LTHAISVTTRFRDAVHRLGSAERWVHRFIGASRTGQATSQYLRE
jgi:hypothetical protein